MREYLSANSPATAENKKNGKINNPAITFDKTADCPKGRSAVFRWFIFLPFRHRTASEKLSGRIYDARHIIEADVIIFRQRNKMMHGKLLRARFPPSVLLARGLQNIRSFEDHIPLSALGFLESMKTSMESAVSFFGFPFLLVQWVSFPPALYFRSRISPVLFA